MPNKSIVISGLAVASVIGGLAYWVLSGDEATAPTPPRAETPEKSTSTIADKWQWQNFARTESVADDSDGGKPRATSAVPDNAVAVYRILQSIRLDDGGRVVPDQTLKQALEEGFDEFGPNLSPAAMSALQDLIRTGLPGPAGQEVADILGNYYRFRVAEMDFDRQLENRLPATEAEFNRQTNSASTAAARHEELVQLRRSFLGKEVADKLFDVEDAHARHMFAAVAIQQNASLTDEQKQKQLADLQAQLNDRLLAQGLLDPAEAAAEKVRLLREKGATSTDIYSTRQSILGTEDASKLAASDREEAQWQSRFNGFWQARRYVMQAGMDEAERDRQIEQLLEQYFSPEERDRARATSADWQARDSK